jgi:hypothetical protein
MYYHIDGLKLNFKYNLLYISFKKIFIITNYNNIWFHYVMRNNLGIHIFIKYKLLKNPN